MMGCRTEFLKSVLETLPGVDPNNEAAQNAMGSLASPGDQGWCGSQESPQNVPPWHTGYFDLKQLKHNKLKKSLSPPPYLPKEIQIEKSASGREP